MVGCEARYADVRAAVLMGRVSDGFGVWLARPLGYVLGASATRTMVESWNKFVDPDREGESTPDAPPMLSYRDQVPRCTAPGLSTPA